MDHKIDATYSYIQKIYGKYLHSLHGIRLHFFVKNLQWWLIKLTWWTTRSRKSCCLWRSRTSPTTTSPGTTSRSRKNSESTRAISENEFWNIWKTQFAISCCLHEQPIDIKNWVIYHFPRFWVKEANDMSTINSTLL